MPPSYGTLLSYDELAATQQTVAQIGGEERVVESIIQILADHNMIMQSMLGDLVTPTTERLVRYGTPATMVIEEADEMGRPQGQKVPFGSLVGFPLKKYVGGLQWTRQYMKKARGFELAAQVDALMTADKLNRERQIKKALFLPTNYTSEDPFVDHLPTSYQIPVKALVNADGAPLPPDPYGNTFNASTHTHYLATSSFVDADLAGALSTVTEHYAKGQALIYINQAQEATVRGFASFTPYVDARLVMANNVTYAGGVALDQIQIQNRAIGVYKGAEVWVKPWMIPSYVFTFMKGGPNPPLGLRTDPDYPSDLTLATENEAYPLIAKIFDQYFGIGAWERTNGSVLYTGGGTYAAPTIT